MSTRWGGFRLRSTILSNWSNMKSPSSSVEEAPVTAQNFDYTQAQGIWDLKATTQFSKKPIPVLSFSFVASSFTSGSSTITIPATAQVGDIAVLFDTQALGSLATPSGWTQIANTNSTFEDVLSYRLLTAGNPGSSVTGMSNTQYMNKIMLVFRPSTSISSVSITSLNNSGETSAQPTNQTVSATTPSIIIGAIGAYGSSPALTGTFWTGDILEGPKSTAYARIYYEIQNETATTRTVAAGADYGTYNRLYSFAISEGA
jgi:hypothetical protein